MDFFDMEFHRFFRIVHAHTMTCESYRYELDGRAQTPANSILEIGLVEQVPLLFEFLPSRRRLTVNQGDLYVIPPGQHIQVSAVSPGKHTHTSVEFLIDCTLLPPSDEAPAAAGDRHIRLPFLLPAAVVGDELSLPLRQLARDRMRMVPKSYFEECGAFMQLLSLIASAQRRQASGRGISPAHLRYCHQVKEYITQNIHRRISMSELAAHVGVSRNYLTNLFSACEQQPISEYINRVKLNHLLELMDKYGVSMQEAAEAVGFSDVNYVSRIFRKYYGVTLSEHRRMLRK